MLVALDGNPRMLSALLAFGAYIHASSIDGGQSVFSSAEFGTENNIHEDYCPAVFTSLFDFVFNVITWSWLKIKIKQHKRPLNMIIWRHAERMTCQVDQLLI